MCRSLSNSQCIQTLGFIVQSLTTKLDDSSLRKTWKADTLNIDNFSNYLKVRELCRYGNYKNVIMHF